MRSGRWLRKAWSASAMVSSLPCGSAIMRASLRACARSSGVCCARASRRSASASSTARSARRSPVTPSVYAPGRRSGGGRAVLQGGDELALDGIDAEAEALQRVGAEHVEIAGAAEQADGVQRSSLEGDEHFGGVTLDDLAF